MRKLFLVLLMLGCAGNAARIPSLPLHIPSQPQVPVTPMLLRLVECYKPKMTLERWDITVLAIKDSTASYYATTSWDLRGFGALITFNMAFMADADDSLARNVVVHELTHVLTAELYYYAWHTTALAADIANERIAEQVAAWALWTPLCEVQR